MTTTEVEDRIETAKKLRGGYDLDTAFSREEWRDILWAARERGISLHTLIHNAVMEDLYR